MSVGCSTWEPGFRWASIDNEKVPIEHVVILFEPPQRPYEQIGIVSSIGGVFASEGDMFRKIQMAAAGLGADAIILRGSGTGTAVQSRGGITVVQTQTVSNYWDYPRTHAIAIKYK